VGREKADTLIVIGEDAVDRYRAPALDKGLDILELLAATEEGLSQAEIAKALDRTPNEIYRMLDRLVRRHYVARSHGDRYELTLKLFALAHQHAPMRRLVSQAMPELRTFARQAEQACHVADLLYPPAADGGDPMAERLDNLFRPTGDGASPHG